MSEDVRPDQAMTLEQVIDQRFKDLLTLATEPKELTAALVAASDWWAAKKKHEDGALGGWGKALGGGTIRGDER